MKGQKFWALLGGFAIATSCTTAFAADASKGTTAKTNAHAKTSAKKPAAFNELKAGKNARGIALDDLFDSFKKGLAQPSKAEPRSVKIADITPRIAPTAHLDPVHKSVSKVAGKQPPRLKSSSKVKPAVYTPSDDDGQTLLAVSGGGSDKPIVSAWLDKPGAVPKYKSGDKMVVKLEAKQDCNVLVFDYDSKGTLTQLFPNEFESNGTMKAGSQIELGGADSKYTLDIAGKGIERIFVYAYPTTEGPITVAMNPVAHTPFRSVEITPDQYRRLVRESRTYFEQPGHDRSVKVTPKGGVQPVSTASEPSDKQSNKLELTFQIDK